MSFDFTKQLVASFRFVAARNTSPRWRGFLADIAAATGGHYLER